MIYAQLGLKKREALRSVLVPKALSEASSAKRELHVYEALHIIYMYFVMLILYFYA
ncbi:hypothetical protein HanRHA438_Chr08g0368501 [Helianthus annuus]|nr:hypothetical protein HanIR_Chr08g0384651 [Helianthus annuus]KAJ0899428.1 hypothetical protein HanRHA438_Chr08g0368501 [Helianthus annuus]